MFRGSSAEKYVTGADPSRAQDPAGRKNAHSRNVWPENPAPALRQLTHRGHGVAKDDEVRRLAVLNPGKLILSTVFHLPAPCPNKRRPWRSVEPQARKYLRVFRTSDQ